MTYNAIGKAGSNKKFSLSEKSSKIENTLSICPMDVKYVAMYLISLENLNDVKFRRVTLCDVRIIRVFFQCFNQLWRH